MLSDGSGFGGNRIIFGLFAVKCVSISNQPCQPRPAIDEINSNQPLYYQFTVSVNKCGRICNTIDDPYALICVPNEVKSMNGKAFNIWGK